MKRVFKFSITKCLLSTLMLSATYASAQSANNQQLYEQGLNTIKQGYEAKNNALMNKGVAMMEKAANAGHGEAAFNVAAFHHGMGGLPADRNKECLWVTKAAKLSYVNAYWGAASCSVRGISSEANPNEYVAKIMPWMRKIAAEDTADDAQDARNFIADYENAKGSQRRQTLGDLINKFNSLGK